MFHAIKIIFLKVSSTPKSTEKISKGKKKKSGHRNLNHSKNIEIYVEKAHGWDRKECFLDILNLI